MTHVLIYNRLKLFGRNLNFIIEINEYDHKYFKYYKPTEKIDYSLLFNASASFYTKISYYSTGVYAQSDIYIPFSTRNTSYVTFNRDNTLSTKLFKLFVNSFLSFYVVSNV